MQSHGTTHGSVGEGELPEPIAARVVLVGRTGLDAKLRLDPDLELIRVRSPLDAIGELANPVGGSATRTIVIVGQDADVGGRSGSPEEFVRAVHKIIPDAVVLGSSDANSPVPAAYEGMVERDITTDRLRILVHGQDRAIPAPAIETPIFVEHKSHKPVERHVVEPQVVETDIPEYLPEAKPEPEPKPEPEIQAEPEATQGPVRDEAMPEPELVDEPLVHREMTTPISNEGDGPLVAAVLGGRNVVEAAMGVLLARVGRADLVFVQQSDDVKISGEHAVAVEFDSKLFGYLMSDTDPESLKPRSEQAVLGMQGLDEHARWLAGWLALAEQQRRLRAEAMTDRVSGAWNRRYFDRFLSAAIEQAKSRRQMLTVLVFDLDNFKSFNDEYGHEAGDLILRETVNLVHSLTRPTDRICRIGGDEFAVIFYEPEGPRDENSQHPTDFAAVAERFQRAVTGQRFPKLGIDAPGRLTVSGGLATFPWDGASPEELLRCADGLAMESKRSGKNTITLGSMGRRAE